MDSKPATIVIPCYGQAHWLPDAIESALAQTVPCEVIVVDDGSPDDVYAVASKYPVTYIRQQNKGLSGARNTGIRCVATEWVLPLDADDKIDPTMVEKCLAVGADIVGVGQETFGDYVEQHMFDRNPQPANFLKWNQINCCSLFRKSMWEKLGGYDEAMRDGYEDWDFWIRATQAGYSVATVQEYLFYYRKHGTSMVSGSISKHDELLEYMLKKLVQKNN